jgi:autotransporter-associated beta strand protein
MWNDPIENTPSIVQTNFGPYGDYIPADGEMYCAPTSVVMGLYWLASNGFTQLAPATYGGADDQAALSLELIIAGLVGTSPTEGTLNSMTGGIADYFAACGIATSQYAYTGSGNPGFTWLAAQLAPNVASDPETIALGVFWVGWYAPPSQECPCDDTLCYQGGHTLAPLTVDPGAGKITINNADPASFLNVPNEPSEVQQTVTLQTLPDGWTLEGLSLPSQDYSEVVTDKLGNGTNYAILLGADVWAIKANARPSVAGYEPATWQIDTTKSINTNGGTLTVLAPLAGTGGLEKLGNGTLLLNNSNDLTGSNIVYCGILASTQTSGNPFGSSAVTLTTGGTLQLAPSGSTPVKAQIASGNAAQFTASYGGGSLQLNGTNTYFIIIGGCTDGVTPNITRIGSGTLLIAPGGDTTALGLDQKVLVTGTSGNLPAVTYGIVSPYILGADTSPAASGTFLTYDAVNGFAAASTTRSTSVGINSVECSTVYEVLDTQTIAAGGSAQVAALEMNGGIVSGSGAQLLVGSQAAGTVAGIIMNAGTIAVDTLVLGDAEGAIYSSNADTGTSGREITSTITGTDGLTFFGPGSLTLWGDNGTSLSGAVNLNAGTLVAAGSYATGVGDVLIHNGATLQVTSSVASTVTVGQSGTLYLNGGTMLGAVTVASIGSDTSLPGGIIQGGGTIAGEATISGVIQSGLQAGILQFQNKLVIAGQSLIYWRLLDYVDDNTHGTPGVDWNALQFDGETVMGSATAYPMFLIDFRELGSDPDGGNPFWNQSHEWTFIMLGAPNPTCYWDLANAYYSRGNFDLSWTGPTIFMTWTPAPLSRSLAERFALQAGARRAARQRRQPTQATLAAPVAKAELDDALPLR